MKRIKLLAVILCLTVAFAFCGTGCQSQQEAEIPEENVDYEIALITDEALVQNGSHSEVAWNTIVEFGGTHGISHKYYKAAEPTEDAFIETIKEAINHGAKLVIIDNSTMDSAAAKMQKEYPEIKFAMTDTDPYDENGEPKIGKNTVAVSFNAMQAGFLAGYAAVIEGNRDLGFIGESDNKGIKEFGFGYVKGAEKGAMERGGTINMQYEYCEDSSDREAAVATAKAMYDNGAKVIFAAGGNIQDAVIEAAELCDGQVIGSITDQSAKSDKVITSATFNIKKALEDVLTAYVDDEFPGGEVLIYSAANDGIGLALRTNGLTKLTQDQYDNIMKEMAKGEIKLKLAKELIINEMNVNRVVFVTGDDGDDKETER